MSPTLAEVRGAARRLEGHVRCTPTLDAAVGRNPYPDLLLKLENLQVSGSFKARGALNKALQVPAEARARGLVTASGGNHGLGVAYAGQRLGCAVRIFLPTSTPAEKLRKLEAWGAEVVLEGAVWDEANLAALAYAEAQGAIYVHPFADPEVIAGQGTVALECVEQAPERDLYLIAIGGGGLIAGCALALKALRPDAIVIGVEPRGAATLQRSIQAGELVTLDRLETAATSLAPRRSEALNLALIQAHVDEVVLVDDADLRDAARWLWDEFGLAVELSAAAAVAALRSGAYVPTPGRRPLALVCGSGAPPA
ncbi:MAG: pyridoxal-phosphate dependent enzyme [Planctomycetes bacterium]|nr:pyridoxal-phosphate dependent enzyme [Planctomycetota bacterium]